MTSVTLDPYSDDQSDRVDICHGASEDKTDQRLWFTYRHNDHGVQIGQGGTEKMEEIEGI